MESVAVSLPPLQPHMSGLVLHDKHCSSVSARRPSGGGAAHGSGTRCRRGEADRRVTATTRGSASRSFPSAFCRQQKLLALGKD